MDLHLDFETYCDLNLKTVGLYRYVEHPSFSVLCVAWKLGAKPVRSAVPKDRNDLPDELKQALTDRAWQGHAWNAAFETAVLWEYFGVKAANPLSCTMQRALAYGLPARLDRAGDALGLTVVKDTAGKRLMMRMTKPCLTDEECAAWHAKFGPAEFSQLLRYCEQDVLAEEAIGKVIPPLTPDERALSALDFRMNRTGVGVNLYRVRALRDIATKASMAEAQRCATLTGGAVTSPGTQTAKLLAWLQASGVPFLPDLARASVEEALAALPVSYWGSGAREVLEIRLRAARASVRKLDAMLAMGNPLRGQFQFLGAGRTGRWSGRGVQVQNLPRVPKGFLPDNFIAGSAVGVNALDGVSWSLRSCLQAADPSQSILWGFDFSQIEARVLAWLAGQQDVLQVFRSGTDIYVWAAGQVGSQNRQLGKVLTLALGYGMGAVKLRETARKVYGVDLTPEQAESLKGTWRMQNRHIVGFWGSIEQAAWEAVAARGRTVAAWGGVSFTCTAKTLQMRLPSGRTLYYHAPALQSSVGGVRVDTLTYMGTEAGGGWGRQHTWGGKLAENATQAVARDIMAEAMLRVQHRLGRVPVMTVHDELVYSIALTDVAGPQKAGDSIEQVVMEAPAWAGGLPIDGEAKWMQRYGAGIPLDVVCGTAGKP